MIVVVIFVGLLGLAFSAAVLIGALLEINRLAEPLEIGEATEEEELLP